MESSEDPKRDDAAGTTGEAVDQHATVYEQTFGLSPETARLAAEDNLKTGERKPASDDVDEARAAEARATDPRR